MGYVDLVNVSKLYGRRAAVDRVSLSVEEGEFVSFLGGSGCGKTTTLRMIAGFEEPTGGRILIAGGDVVATPPNRRGVGMVFQSYALFPNMTARQNVAFGLRVAGRVGTEIEERVAEMLALVHLSEFADRYPHQLSGGQQQRVALARALAVRPRVLLLDEPLSALDAKIRVRLRGEIRAIQRALGITTIYVTHDQEEALSISDRVVVMRDGRIEQVGTPHEIYNRPATPFVASFIGSLNVLSATVVDPIEGLLRVGDQVVAAPAPIAAPAGQAVRVSLRPEALALRNGTPENNHLRGTVTSVVFLGSIVRLVVRAADHEILLDTFNAPHVDLPPVGAEVTVGFPREACILLGAEAQAPEA